ncbi:T9SS type A sorting domain-containing protein [Epilithonimonas sp.]|uniref:T9SS type A sorting domain-containing protein n=1 Tax=Epilithonimonas sp. TaxID=2894511 RepID=UPI002FDD04A1
MKAKLLLAASLFAVVAQAQLATINENFDNFTAGSNIFPQNGWSTKLPISQAQPQPIMIVTPGENKSIQAYPGSTVAQPMYLITPQIVAPAGDKILSFDTAMVAGGFSTIGTVQVGLVTDPTDMTTFVAVGNPIELTSTTIQNVKVSIPASAATYLVIRTTSSTMHTPIHIDNVKYDTNLAVNESTFNSNNVKFAVSADNNSLKFVSTTTLSNAKIYSAAGHVATEGKISNNTLNISTLKSGVYFIIIEDNAGQTVKSKFIKK